MDSYKNPGLATDAIILNNKRIALVKRRNPPYGWALPGGFINEGESASTACAREAFEETNLRVTPVRQFHTYSKPDRDLRKHVVSIVYYCVLDRGQMSEIKGKDDAVEAKWFDLNDLPDLAFDHGKIIADFMQWCETMLFPSALD